MSTAYRKVLRDLWSNRARTALVVLSIAVGVMAVGMILSSNSVMEQRMRAAQLASLPSQVWVSLGTRVDDSVVSSVERMPQVAAARGHAGGGAQWKPEPAGEWQDADLTALDDYQAQELDLLVLQHGEWPSSSTVAVEWNHVEPFGVPGIGATIYFEVNGHPRPYTVAGVLRDPNVAAPPFSDRPSFYVTRDELGKLSGSRDFGQLGLAVEQYSEDRALEVADLVQQKLERQGVPVGSTRVQDPARHWAQDILDGVGLILIVMAITALFLSAILVINTINAIIAQQVPQIGIMKTVGGVRRQISRLYLAGVAIYGMVALALAVPLGAIAGYSLSLYMLNIINVPATGFKLIASSVWIQLGAGLLVPLLAALWPILRGVAISVADAIRRYGVGSGRYGTGRIDRMLAAVHGLPSVVTLSLRNTFRRLGRVSMTLAVLILAGAAFMMVLTTHYSFTHALNAIWDGLGFDTFVVFDGLQRVEEVVPLIEEHPAVEQVEMWSSLGATIRVPGDTALGSDRRIYLQGYPRDTQMFIPELTAGRDLDPGDGHAILLNQKLASELGVGPGDEIELDLGGAGKSQWTIVGLIFDLINDQATGYVHADTVNRDLNRSGRGAVARISSNTSTLDEQERLKDDLEQLLESNGIGVAFTRASVEDQEQAEAQFSILTTILMTMTVVMAAVGSIGLSGTLSINVIERRREIGVMRAVGGSSGDVALIMILEGLLLGLVSWAAAVPLSILVGRPFVEQIGGIVEFPSPYQFSFAGLWIWLLIVLALSLFASWLPAKRASQISVNESLAYE